MVITQSASRKLEHGLHVQVNAGFVAMMSACTA
jgi:hypothetical protein